jgi:hypothetical protein
MLTCARGYHLVDRSHDHRKQDPEFGVVFWPNIETSNFRQAFHSDVSELVNLKELHHKSIFHIAAFGYRLTLVRSWSMMLVSNM